MTPPFHFKKFSITQKDNGHKVGTDSVLLGAWTQGNFKRILDIGTGTGVLALMMAQKFEEAAITAIEPQHSSCLEARQNFIESPFKDRILAIETELQNFGSMDRFDLIICNPPYFNASYLSGDELRDSARQAIDLDKYELFENAAELLAENGRLNIVIPYTEEHDFIMAAIDFDLHIQEIMHSTKANGEKRRSFISFGFKDIEPITSTIVVKDFEGKYTTDYIQLTKDFYLKDLSN